MGRFVGLVCSVLALGVALAACGGADKKAAAYRDKARERYHKGEFDKAAANYQKAVEVDKKKKLAGLAGEQRRALREHVLSRLKDAWGKFDRGDYEDAHDIVLQLHVAEAYGDKGLQQQIVKSLGDLAAARMDDAWRMADKGQFLPAVALAKHLVKPLPADHSLQIHVTALRRKAVAIHTLLMSRSRGKPGSVAFHYLMTQLFGGDRLNVGIDAVRAAKRAGGDSSSHVSSARSAATAGRTADAEHSFVLGRAASSSSEWDSGGVKFFKEQWGIPDDKALESLWTGDPVTSPYADAKADELPSADFISIDDDDSGGSVAVGSTRWRELNLWYGLGTQTLDDTNMSSKIGADLYMPRKKYAHRPSFFFESDSLGGNISGYGVEWQIQKRFKKAMLGIGVGYWESEQVEEIEDAVPLLKARSAYIPVSLRYPLVEGIVIGADFQANYFHLVEKDEESGYEEYSTATGRLYMPLPLLPELHKLFRNLSLEGYVGYADGAPNDLHYGGKVVYHRGMSGGGGGGKKKLWKSLEDSVFATQSVLGPTIDLWYQLGGSHLGGDLNAHGMGALFRIPTDKPKRAKTIIEPSVWVFASGFGGDVGGWGVQMVGLKPVNSLGGVFGYGLGYSSSSQSEEVPEGSLELKQRAFYIPLIFRMPLASKLIASLEFRGNLLGLGGTKEAGEDRAFSPVTAGLWTPLPVLGSLGGFFKKLHIEARVSYAHGAPSDVEWGGSLVYRPIVDID